jgi:Tannase and feruloyl esterase
MYKQTLLLKWLWLALLSNAWSVVFAASPVLPQLSAAHGVGLLNECVGLSAKLTELPHTRIISTELIPTGTLAVGDQPIAEHCRVTGKMHERKSLIDGKTYSITFEIRLPKEWNGRFLHQGNGGIDGVVQPAIGSFGGGPLTHALHQGFVVLSSDAGHAGANPAFGVDPQARLDYGYQAVSKLTPMAKLVINVAYGKSPDRSYFAGCSNGGRHAMVAATRYFEDYDGILAGAPGYNLPRAAIANLAGARLYKSVATADVKSHIDLATALTDKERQLVAHQVLEKCDALDGVTDGIAQDVAACQKVFSLQKDVPTCAGARDGSCLTQPQKQVLAQIFSGPKNAKGQRIYASFPFDGGFGSGRAGVSSGGNPVGSGIAFWEFFASTQLDSGATGIIFKVPPENPEHFNALEFSLTTNIDALLHGVYSSNDVYKESAMTFMTPPNPENMKGLRSKGGKIIVYHGVSDSIFSINDSVNWLQLVQRHTGQDFVKLYPIPGMGHCSGGPATDQFDMLTPLVKWVEEGVEPESVEASARGVGNLGGVNPDVPSAWHPGRTRPLCPFPKVARYNGAGDIEKAENFTCK